LQQLKFCVSLPAPALTLAENGPYSLTHNLTLQENPYGWDVNANVIYVDQPINTGFSWSDVSGPPSGTACVPQLCLTV